MKSETFYLNAAQGVRLFTKKWYTTDNIKVKGVIQIAHGMGETTEYYKEFSEEVVKAGYIVYMNEARGHGRTAGDITDLSYVENAGYLGEDGINLLVDDLKLLTDIIKNTNPGLPVFLLGHSLGSVLAQIYAYKYGNCIDGIIYSGTTGPIDREKIKELVEVVSKEVKKVGRKASSIETADCFFKHYNDEFQPVRTDYDWLNSDSIMLDNSLSSPYAAINYKVGYYEDLIYALKDLHNEKLLELISKSIHIFSISGDKDPFGDNGEGVKQLFKIYRDYGIKNATYKIYKNGRHEMLREVNRKEVINDVLGWLDGFI